MGVYEILNSAGELDYGNQFNGRLGDYLTAREDRLSSLFNRMLEVRDDLRIHTDYVFDVNIESIANKKIGYRDLRKVPQGTAFVPYLIYWQEGETERALMLNTDSAEEAKGMYYCLTEPDNPLAEYKSEILALYANGENDDVVLDYFTRLAQGKQTAGALQRNYDSQHIGSIDEMKEHCAAAGAAIFAETQAKLAEMTSKKDKSDLIYRTVLRVFYLKKGLYVRYMTSRQLLSDRHGGNIVEQRAFAKSYCNEVSIVPFYTLWNPDAPAREQ